MTTPQHIGAARLRINTPADFKSSAALAVGMLLFFSMMSATAQESAPPPTDAGTDNDQPVVSEGASTGSASRNFSILMSRSVQGAASRTFTIVMKGLMWSVLFLLAGCGIAVTLYFVLKKRGLIRGPWQWYGRVRWLWMVYFLILFAGTGAYGGFWIGAGGEFKRMLAEDRLIDRVAANIMLASSLESASLELDDEEHIDRIVHQMKISEPIGDMARRDFGKRAKPIIRHLGERADAEYIFEKQGWGEKILLRLLLEGEISGSPYRWHSTDTVADEDIAAGVGDRLDDLQPHASLLFFAAMAAASTSADDYVKTHPGASRSAAIYASVSGRLRRKALQAVGSLIATNVAITMGLGVILFLLPVGVFYIIKSRVGGHDDAEEAPPPEPSPTDPK